MLAVRYKKGSGSPLILLLVIGVLVGSAGVMNPGLCGVDNPDSSERLVASEGVSLEAIETSLEHADWKGLAKMLAPTPEPESVICNTEPKLRFLKGHALLATNRNNEATVCFACAEDTTGSATLKAWQAWTKDLVRKHPDWPSARYLYADALARLGLFEEATFELDQVLAISPQDHLARNARGVMNWMMGVQDTTLRYLQNSAITDFQMAGQQAGFADAWVNLGVLDLYEGYNPQNAKENFNQALNRDSSFALAVNGRACAFGALGDLKQAQKEIARAKHLCSAVAFIAANAVSVAHKGEMTSEVGKLVSGHGKAVSRGTWTVTAGWQGLGPVGTISYQQRIGRGGIYIQLREGENLLVDREGNPRVIGTWFVLNYPASK